MGNPDLSDPGGSQPRRGLVIFPADAPPRAPTSGGTASAVRGLGDWWLVIGAIALGAVVIAVALLVR